MKYPLNGGKKLTNQERKLFDKFRESYKWVIEMTNFEEELNLTTKQIKALIYSCAVMAMWYETQKTIPRRSKK